jgi:hypothetical protein
MCEGQVAAPCTEMSQGKREKRERGGEGNKEQMLNRSSPIRAFKINAAPNAASDLHFPKAAQ